jgi:mRNA-degrading endonuclease RelE of RelBE toxin-antitoxin system
MKKVVTTPDVDLALRTLGPEEVRQIRAWFDHLADWDGDAFVRENSHALAGVPGVLMLRTGSDMRIFFSVEGDTITVLDVAKKRAILMTAAAGEGR